MCSQELAFKSVSLLFSGTSAGKYGKKKDAFIFRLCGKPKEPPNDKIPGSAVPEDFQLSRCLEGYW